MASVPSGSGFPGLRLDRSSAVSGNAFAVAAMVFWAAGFPAAEALLQVWHPIALMALRLLMAMAVLIPLWIFVDGPQALIRARWGRGIWVGIFGFGAGTNLLLFAQWYTDPVTVALIATTTPISATLIEVISRQRRLSGRFVIGLAASVVGGAIAVSNNLSADLSWGLLMAIASGLCFSWASNAAVRDFPDLSPIGRSTITFAGAAMMTFVLFFVTWGIGWVEAPRIETSAQWGNLAIYSVAAMALAQILFIASVARLGIALTSFHINIAPFYVMLVMIALGGGWDWRAATGAAIVGIGVLLSQERRRTS